MSVLICVKSKHGCSSGMISWTFEFVKRTALLMSSISKINLNNSSKIVLCYPFKLLFISSAHIFCALLSIQAPLYQLCTQNNVLCYPFKSQTGHYFHPHSQCQPQNSALLSIQNTNYLFFSSKSMHSTSTGTTSLPNSQCQPHSQCQPPSGPSPLPWPENLIRVQPFSSSIPSANHHKPKSSPPFRPRGWQECLRILVTEGEGVPPSPSVVHLVPRCRKGEGPLRGPSPRRGPPYGGSPT